MKNKGTPASGSLSAKRLYDRYGAGLVAIVTVDALGDERTGSAFHVGDGVFVTARHVVEGHAECRVELDAYRAGQLAEDATDRLTTLHGRRFPVHAFTHPDPAKDVAVFAVPALAALPAIPPGYHLDDAIIDDDFVLNEVLVLGFPPIPLSRQNVLVAARGQINAVVRLINVPHAHFVVSTTARGGFSGGVVLSEWGFALGVVTSSLVKNDAPEELGYLTVLAVEPILECLAAHALLPRAVALDLDGLYTAKTEYFGVPEKGWAHSWIRSDRDGHRARVLFATPDPVVITRAIDAVGALEGLAARHHVEAADVHVWELDVDYALSEAPLDLVRKILRTLLLDRNYRPVERPSVMDRTLQGPTFPPFCDTPEGT